LPPKVDSDGTFYPDESKRGFQSMMGHVTARTVMALVRVWCWVCFPVQIVRFRRVIGRWPDPALPRHRNDKYLWRKIFDRNPLFIQVSDKLLAKQFAVARCPTVKVARTLWTGQSAEDIPDDLLRGNVVVKANHGSGWNIFIRNGQYDRGELNRTANRWLASRFGKRHAEWGYYAVRPCLFVEEMLLDKDEPLNNEYKFYCGSGDIAFTFVRQPGADGRLLEGVLDAQGKVRAGGFDSGELSADVSKPPEWDALVATALALSQEFDFVRCDLYAINGEVYFSELTLYTLGGLAWVDDSELNERYTRLWDLRQSWFMRTPQRGWRRLYVQALDRLLQ
jgi:hypothetical protein